MPSPSFTACAQPATRRSSPAVACATSCSAVRPRTMTLRPMPGSARAGALPGSLPVGVQFGVVLVPSGDHRIEVATFRRDGVYLDSRHPVTVTFGAPRRTPPPGLHHQRHVPRPIEDRVIDYVGGRDDLARGVVRAIGDPAARLDEDKLRMLRAVRIAARLDFAIDPPPGTSSAARPPTSTASPGSASARRSA